MIETSIHSRPSLEITRDSQSSDIPVVKTTRLLVPKRFNPAVINRSVERITAHLNDTTGSWMDSEAERLRRHLVHHIGIQTPTEIAVKPSNPVNYLLREEQLANGDSREFLYIFELDSPGAVLGHTLIHQDKWVTKLFEELVPEENRLSSGRVAEKIYGSRSFAMIDRLREGRDRIQATDPIGRLINTLYSNRYIPVGNDGRVLLPIT